MSYGGYNGGDDHHRRPPRSYQPYPAQGGPRQQVAAPIGPGESQNMSGPYNLQHQGYPAHGIIHPNPQAPGVPAHPYPMGAPIYQQSSGHGYPQQHSYIQVPSQPANAPYYSSQQQMTNPEIQHLIYKPCSSGVTLMTLVVDGQNPRRDQTFYSRCVWQMLHELRQAVVIVCTQNVYNQLAGFLHPGLMPAGLSFVVCRDMRVLIRTVAGFSPEGLTAALGANDPNPHRSIQYCKMPTLGYVAQYNPFGSADYYFADVRIWSAQWNLDGFNDRSLSWLTYRIEDLRRHGSQSVHFFRAIWRQDIAPRLRGEANFGGTKDGVIRLTQWFRDAAMRELGNATYLLIHAGVGITVLTCPNRYPHLISDFAVTQAVYRRQWPSISLIDVHPVRWHSGPLDDLDVVYPLLAWAAVGNAQAFYEVKHQQPLGPPNTPAQDQAITTGDVEQ